MRTEKVLPETLLQLMLNVLETAPDFIYKKGIQPFLMEIGGKDYYVYVKNLSSAYFKTRPDTTRAQLPVKEDFDEIKHSIIPFVFLGYDRINDVLVCWNHHIAKQRLNERKSVSFYSRSFFQEEVVSGEFLKKNLKNGDTPVLFKRKDIVLFFRNIDSFFGKPTNDSTSRYGIPSNGKILKITDNGLLKKLRPLLDTESSWEVTLVTTTLSRLTTGFSCPDCCLGVSSSCAITNVAKIVVKRYLQKGWCEPASGKNNGLSDRCESVGVLLSEGGNTSAYLETER